MTYYECVFMNLVIHQARRISLITSPVASLAAQYFPTLPQQRQNFGGGDIEHKMCVLIFSANLCGTFLILRKTGLRGKYAFFLSYCN